MLLTPTPPLLFLQLPPRGARVWGRQLPPQRPPRLCQEPTRRGLAPAPRTPCPRGAPAALCREWSLRAGGAAVPEQPAPRHPQGSPSCSRAVPNPPHPRWGHVSRRYLWNSRFVKPLTLGPKPVCPPGSPCQCILKCNPGTLSEPLFCKKGTYHNSWTSPFRRPLRASVRPGCLPAPPQPLPCMLLASPFVSQEFLFWGLDFLCSCFDCSLLFYLFAH